MDFSYQAGNKLISVLEQLCSLHDHLKQVLEKEQQLTVDCQLSELESIQKRKLEIADKISQLEMERQEVVAGCCKLFKIEYQELPKLEKLKKNFSKDQQNQLSKIHNNLLELINTIQDLVKVTSTIAKARLISLTTITTQLDKWMTYHTFYSRFGSVKNNSQTRFLSRHI